MRAFLLATLLASPLSAQQVTLSLDRFQELWDQANPKPTTPPPPLSPLVLEAAQIAVAVSGETARLHSEITIVLYGDGSPPSEGWQTLPLPGLGAFLAASGEGVETSLVDASGTPQLRLRGKGRHRVTLESVLPVPVDRSAVEPERSLEIELPEAGWVSGSLTAPAEVARVTALAGGILRQDGPGRWSFLGEPGGSLRLRLLGEAPHVTPADLGPLRFNADTASSLLVSRARRRLNSWIVLHVWSGELSTLRLPVPAGYEVLNVSGDAVAGWTLGEGGIEVQTRAPVRGDTTIQTQLAADPALAFDCPLLVPSGAASVRGALKVAVRTNDGLLEIRERGDALPFEDAAKAGLPVAFQSSPGEPLRLAASDRPPQWTVTWASGSEDVLNGQIDRLLVEALIGESGQIHYQLWAEVRNGEAFLGFGLPAGSRLLRSLRDGVAVNLGEATGGGSSNTASDWAVPMVVREAPQTIYLEALLPGGIPPGGGTFSLPLPRLAVPASQVEVRVLAPPGYRYTLADPTRVGLIHAPPDQGPQLLAPPPGFATLMASWTAWSKEPPPLAINVAPETTGRRAR